MNLIQQLEKEQLDKLVRRQGQSRTSSRATP